MPDWLASLSSSVKMRTGDTLLHLQYAVDPAAAKDPSAQPAAGCALRQIAAELGQQCSGILTGRCSMPSINSRSSNSRSSCWVVFSFILFTALWSASCGRQSADAPPDASPELGVPGRSNEYVSLAASGRYVAAAWAATDEAQTVDVYFAISGDSGLTFGPPVRVNDLPGDARANGEQPPRVSLVTPTSGLPEVTVFWLSRRASGSVLLTSRSTDGGQHFSNATIVAGTDAAGNRGWHAMSASPDGSVLLAWLDHRRMAAAAGTNAPHHHHAGATTAAPPANAVDTVETVATAQLSDLYFAGSPDDPSPKALTSGVCYCCKTAMAHAADGAIYIAWRHVYPGNMRDIAFTISRDGGQTFSTPVRVSEDRWSIAGCPDDGPAMAVDAGGRVHLVWPTVVTASDGSMQKSIFHSMTTDGKTFTPRVVIPHGEAIQHNHPQVAATGDGAIVVAWDGYIGGAPHVFRARGSLDDGGVMQFKKVDEDPPLGNYPVVIASDTYTITAWASRGTAAVIRLTTELTR
jgi:hypothetical protein